MSLTGGRYLISSIMLISLVSTRSRILGVLLSWLIDMMSPVYKRWNCQWSQTAAQIVSNLPAPRNGGPIYRFLGVSRPCGPTEWPVLLLTKAGDVETNPGPTTSHKRVWICDICYKQIHGRKQISMRCDRIEHWVHLRCAGIHQAQYTDTWTCHLHR